jgi:hypothetical protein
MIRDATREEIRKVAAPLWPLVNQQPNWPGNLNKFDLIKSGACSIVAHMAYCAIGADEREKRNRAKVIPCRVYQDILLSEPVDFIDVFSRLDFVNVGVVRTKFFVAIVVPVHAFFLIGVRGTQFAYDWLINLKIFKSKNIGGEYLHSGFLHEAEELAAALRQHLHQRHGQRLNNEGCAIYLAGHSLGGAVAAILSEMSFPAPVNACYVFGAPRISSSDRLSAKYQPFATRRYLDVVPHCPPRTFNYADFANQLVPDGDPYAAADGIELYFFASWLFSLAMKQFPQNHSMERYRLEVLAAVKTHPHIARYWDDKKYPDIQP